MRERRRPALYGGTNPARSRPRPDTNLHGLLNCFVKRLYLVHTFVPGGLPTREGLTFYPGNRALLACSHLKSKSIISKHFLQK